MKFVARLRKTVASWVAKQMTLSGVDSSRGWMTLFKSGLGWQTDTRYSQDDILQHPTVFACANQTAKDVAKLCPRLMKMDEKDGIWTESSSPSFSPVLRKPNHFQSRQQFLMCWVLSKLLNGNTYVLLVRDSRRVVVSMFVLDPNRVTPLVAPDGAVFYALQRDDLSRLPRDYTGELSVPASEIIHDRGATPFHPLVGVPPIWAAHWPASQGLSILKNSDRFFRNSSRPGGLLTTPNEIDDSDALAIKETWEKSYSGANAGRVAILGNDLKYQAIGATALDSQLVEQQKLSAEQICSAFGIPAFMVGVGPLPSFDNVEALNQRYYSSVLQDLIEAIEALTDDALGLAALGFRVEFDLDDLFRMDTLRRAEVLEKYLKTGALAPNEVRAKLGYKAVPGGEAPYLQQQNWPLRQLAERKPPDDGNQLPPAPPPKPDDEPSADEARELSLYLEKAFA